MKEAEQRKVLNGAIHEAIGGVDPRDQLAWLVWFARKTRGPAAHVLDLALEQNPYLRALVEREP